MKTAHDIILKPVITENSMAGIADKKYTFKVATDATKVEIAQALRVLFPGARSQGQHHFRAWPLPPPGYARWLHRCIQEGYRDPDQGLQGDRVLQQHGLSEPAEGSSMGI